MPYLKNLVNRRGLAYLVIVLAGIVLLAVSGLIIARDRAAVAAITAPIEAEAQGVRQANIVKILEPYDPEAVIVEADTLGAPREWSGQKAIFKKYREILRTRKYSRFNHVVRDVRVKEGLAVVVTDLQGEYKLYKGPVAREGSERGELWTLVRRGDRWKILRYVYGQKVPPLPD